MLPALSCWCELVLSLFKRGKISSKSEKFFRAQGPPPDLSLCKTGILSACASLARASGKLYGIAMQTPMHFRLS